MALVAVDWLLVAALAALFTAAELALVAELALAELAELVTLAEAELTVLALVALELAEEALTFRTTLAEFWVLALLVACSVFALALLVSRVSAWAATPT